MKRSEMIELIANDIDCIRKTEQHEASNETLAAILLKHIEEAGMLPPPITIDEDDIDESIHQIDYNGDVMMWEDE